MYALITVSGKFAWITKFIFRKIIFLPLCTWKLSTQTFPQLNDFILNRTLELQTFKLKLKLSNQSSNQELKNISISSKLKSTVGSKVDWIQEVIVTPPAETPSTVAIFTEVSYARALSTIEKNIKGNQDQNRSKKNWKRKFKSKRAFCSVCIESETTEWCQSNTKMSWKNTKRRNKILKNIWRLQRKTLKDSRKTVETKRRTVSPQTKLHKNHLQEKQYK